MRRLAAAVFAMNLFAVTWPAANWFRTAEPLIMGLPLSMAWPIVWILIAWVTLLLLDHSENRGNKQ